MKHTYIKNTRNTYEICWDISVIATVEYMYDRIIRDKL